MLAMTVIKHHTLHTDLNVEIAAVSTAISAR